jgi:hypothetical protein
MVKSNESEGIELYLLAVARLEAKIQADSEEFGLECQQQQRDPFLLYLSAAQSKVIFELFVSELNKEDGVRISCGPLKRMSRILEKILLALKHQQQHQQHQHQAELDASKVCDIVRGMGEARDMKEVAKQIHAICNHPDVIALRMKERYMACPSKGGWRGECGRG